MPEFHDHKEKLYKFLTQTATSGFWWWVEHMERRVNACEDKSGGAYLSGLHSELREAMSEELINRIIEGDTKSIIELRLIFAKKYWQT